MSYRADVDREVIRANLSATLRAVREARGLRIADVAARMGIEPRSYSRFEAGEVQADLEKLIVFAEATNCDPLALVASILLERPDLATLCMDSKLASIQALALDQFLTSSAPAAPQVDGATFITVMDAAFEELGRELSARSSFTQTRLGRLLGSLKLTSRS